MDRKQVIFIIILCTVTSVISTIIYGKLSDSPKTTQIEAPASPTIRLVNEGNVADVEKGFIAASKKSTPSVVFIKTESEYQRNSFWFFGFDPFGSVGKVASTGSGVVLSQDGYIITNHHVIKNADKIAVVISDTKKEYTAELVGSDPSSDLALLKIDAGSLTPISFANSDEVEIGQWVVAVGNPFNLTSTVTAGIVSAKGRNINIVNNQFPIESFIQTDAAINPGNSGGALVDLNGDLVGVNTAIASKTGSYIGYGFAIPSNIVAKIVQDLKEFGEIQRGFLGVDVADIDGDIAESLDVNSGVLVERINGSNPHSSEKIEAGDVITFINDVKIESKAQFDEMIAYHRPGDILRVGYVRDGDTKTADIKLVNKEGTTDLIRRESIKSASLGAEFEMASKLERQTYGISSGIKVRNITNGKMRKMNIPEGFIFVKINQKSFDDINKFIEYLDTAKGQIRIEGVSPSGSKQYLSFYFY